VRVCGISEIFFYFSLFLQISFHYYNEEFLIVFGRSPAFIKLHDNGRKSKAKNVCETLAIFSLRFSNRSNAIVITSKRGKRFYANLLCVGFPCIE
jgi:hypothetical protein